MNQLQDTAEKISSMEIRGAGRIAKAAAIALRDYAGSLEAGSIEEFSSLIENAAKLLVDTRPTAVSLPNAVRLTSRYTSADVEEARKEIINNAERFIKQADDALHKIGEIGARRIRDGDVIMTHCNSHAALSIITTAFDQGKDISVIATETRPRRQGLLTSKHLLDHGIPTTLIVDSAVRYFMKEVDTVIVGADAIAVNGALVNKIGTSQLALAANEARKNFLTAAETYKFSPNTILGEFIEIEERSINEVIDKNTLAGLPKLKVRNPAFDITPPEYIDLIITDVGVVPPGMAYTIIKEHLGWEIGEMV
ncbi:MAG: ribose 1,5-bisphosphate isomerase [Methanosarcinaceae archaeon]|nr:ribose 1,5-bisphosphate isomerase [Methanosarcinaceae archaeon]MDF1532984.1 ribose 1,5-bisphosphate isomerase [Methanosarcinaceae archaeon]